MRPTLDRLRALSREPATWALAAIVAVVAVVLSRPYDAGLFRRATGGGDWAEHLARVQVVHSASGDAPLGQWIAQTDGIYPPMLHGSMGLVGAVVGHGEVAIGRAMVLWLLLLAAAAGLCAARITGERRDGWLVAAGTASVPALAAVSLTYFYDLPMTALLWCATAALLWLRPRSPELAGLAAGLLWTGAALTKWTALPFGVAMMAGALIVHLPEERWDRREVVRRLRAALVLAVTTALGVLGFFGLSTVSWRSMSDTTMGDPDAWAMAAEGETVGLLAGLADRLPPFSWSRLGGYPLDLVLSILSPLLALLVLVLLVVWLIRDRRGAALVAAVCLGQWAILFWLVPPADPRFAFTLTPALVLAAALGVGRLPPRVRFGLMAGWMAVALWVAWDVHHGAAGPLDRAWTLQPDRPTSLLSGRGISILSGDQRTGWMRADATAPIFRPDREQLWALLAACDAPALAVQEGALADSTDPTWWRYRNLLAWIEGEVGFDRVVSLEGFDPEGASAVAVSRGGSPGPGWSRVDELAGLVVWGNRPGLCPAGDGG